MQGPLDALWGVRPGDDGPRRQALTVESVVQAAIDLADASGLEVVTMNRVADRLGVTPMALYRHVRNKDELVTLMVDAATGPPTGSKPSDGWRSALERWSRDLLSLVRRRPWLLTVPLARLPFGPNRLGWLERGLQALAPTSLSEDEKAQIVLLLNGYVFSEARLATEVGTGEATAFAGMLDAVVDAERFPAFRRALEAGIFDPAGTDPDAGFAFGLGLILDGVEGLVAARG